MSNLRAIEGERDGMSEAPRFIPRWPSVLKIIGDVAARHGFTADDLLKRSRFRNIVLARHEAMWRAARETRATMPIIGAAFLRDRTTCCYGIQRHEARIAAARGKNE